MMMGALLSPRLLVATVTAMILAAAIVPTLMAWGPVHMPPLCPPAC